MPGNHDTNEGGLFFFSTLQLELFIDFFLTLSLHSFFAGNHYPAGRRLAQHLLQEANLIDNRYAEMKHRGSGRSQLGELFCYHVEAAFSVKWVLTFIFS